jgi:PHD/YefM family antitoxin component YafN of YafNO toxin-antitoxin module
MNTIPAREIKRRGISAVDEALEDGAVYVLRNDRPSYVILNERHYHELVEAGEEAYAARIAASLEDVKSRAFAPNDCAGVD